jgi:Leucine-rich repeat (LRR) protein
MNLWKQHLGRVPESVWEQIDLETLVLADNDLSEVSSRIGQLKKLRMLDLGHNQLTSAPDALGELDGLTDFLYLHDNRLASLPHSMERLRKLRYLNISENSFEAWPDCVCAMSSLIELRASDNRLISLPDSIRRCHGCGSCICGTTG